jgi:tRNA A37 threonylcarbamoyltransferase TsaD
MDAVAVSTRPGLVLCLKAGIDCALGFARHVFHTFLLIKFRNQINPNSNRYLCQCQHSLSHFQFPRDFHRPLVPVHHMRAHAMVQRLLDPQLRFPFSSLLISGAHCLICLAQSPRQFQILAEASGGSPGQCLDHLAKELGLPPSNGHFGAALEKMANK